MSKSTKTTPSHIKVETKYWTTRVVKTYLGLCAQTLIRRREEGLPHTMIPGNKFPIYLYEPRKIIAYAREHGIDGDLEGAKALHQELIGKCAA